MKLFLVLHIELEARIVCLFLSLVMERALSNGGLDFLFNYNSWDLS